MASGVASLPQVGANNYEAMANLVAQKVGIDPSLLKALVSHESGWDPHAVSPVGAMGLGQLMPDTAASLGVSDPHDPMQNLLGTAKYLKEQLTAFHGQVPLALAAYNAGPGAVAKYGGVPPYPETQAYVKGILASLGHEGSTGVGESTLGLTGPSSSPAPAVSGGDERQRLLSLLSTPLPGAAGILQGAGVGANLAQGVDSPLQLPGQKQDQGLLPSLPTQTAPSPPQGGETRGGDVSPQTGLPSDLSVPIIGGLDGNSPMAVGTPNHQYSNLAFGPHVDWTHVNPRLLQAINDQAAKLGTVATVISGYRNNAYSNAVGGFAGDPHTKGLAVDAYINGHPIGEVIPPDAWSKLGITSGAMPGFYKGKPDPEHLQLISTPIKGAKKR